MGAAHVVKCHAAHVVKCHAWPSVVSCVLGVYVRLRCPESSQVPVLVSSEECTNTGPRVSVKVLEKEDFVSVERGGRERD